MREGRRREFAQFPEFAEAAAQGRIPDPTAEAKLCCVPPRLVGARARAAPRPGSSAIAGCCAAARAIVPRLAGIGAGRRVPAARAGGAARRLALGDGALLSLLANFGDAAVPLAERPPGATPALLHELRSRRADEIAPACAAFYLLAVLTSGA